MNEHYEFALKELANKSKKIEDLEDTILRYMNVCTVMYDKIIYLETTLKSLNPDAYKAYVGEYKENMEVAYERC